MLKCLCVGVLTLFASMPLNASIAEANADPVPKRAVGIWGFGNDCGVNNPIMMVSPRAAIIVDDQSIALAKAQYVSQSLLLSFTGADDRLLLPIAGLTECPALPVRISLALAEAISVFERSDDIYDACVSDDGAGAGCVPLVIELIDISNDGKLSQAEVARIMRVAAIAIGYLLSVEDQDEAFVPAETLIAAHLSALAVGPIAAATIIHSYDYDGDGYLSLGEVMQDRVSESGFKGALAAVASEVSPQALSFILRSVDDVMDFLE